MQHSFLGPRGWAVLTIVIGFALSFQLFRKPDKDVQRTAPDTTPQLDFGNRQLAVGAGSQPHAAPVGRVVSGQLPSTDLQPQADLRLPKWAVRGSQLDELIRNPPPGDDQVADLPELQQMQPWMPGSSSPNRRPVGMQQDGQVAGTADELAYRDSPWDHEQGTSRLQEPTTPSADWPDQQLAARPLTRQFSSIPSQPPPQLPNSPIGNLVGASSMPAMPDDPPSRPQAKLSTQPRPARRFVYQPGFQADPTSP